MTPKIYIVETDNINFVKITYTSVNIVKNVKFGKGVFAVRDFIVNVDPIDNVKRFHHGCDFSVSIGTPVYAPADGVIKRAYYLGGFGNHIKVDHSGGYSTIFAHLSKINVKSGQEVSRGEIIGLTGNSGRSTAPHLHYEVIENGKKINSQTLKLPSGKILKGDARKEFEVKRIKIDLKLSNLRY